MIKIGNSPYLECSSRGDKRFSAFYARIKALGNRSIEDLYQASKVFSDGSTGLTWKEAKGRKAVNMPEVTAYYEKLWRVYLNENPELIAVLKKYNGYSDVFGKPGCQCQAVTLYKIVKEERCTS